VATAATSFVLARPAGRRADQQHVPARQHPRQHEFHHPLLAEDRLADLGARAGEQGSGPFGLRHHLFGSLVHAVSLNFRRLPTPGGVALLIGGNLPN